MQLSITNATLRPSNANFLSCSLTQSSNDLEYIQLFFCARYRHGVLLIPLKQQVLFDFPITNIVFFSTRVSCSKASQPNLTIFASTTFLGFQMDTFLWEVLYKINQAQLHCICHRSCNRILWLAKLFPSMEWSHHR